MGKRLTIALVVFALIVVPTAIYTAGYLWLGERRDYYEKPNSLSLIERSYPQQWLWTIYRPAAKVETWLRGIDVEPTYGVEGPQDAGQSSHRL